MTDTNPPQFPESAPVTVQRAADVRAQAIGEGTQITRTYPIRQPEDDWNDFQVAVRASVLRRCRTRLHEIEKQHFHLTEVLLGLSTLSAGATLSALMSGVELKSALGVMFYVIFPMVAVGCGVAYSLLRQVKLRTAQHLAVDVLEELPEPDRAIDVRSR